MRIVLPVDRPKHELPLDDGDVLTLSPVLKSDREFFERGLSELSIGSRFARFGQGVAGLSERELDYLTDVDQRTHVAWGAAIGQEAAGAGRYIVCGEDSSCAEIAITVLDHMQRRGVGSALLGALVAVARADGIDEFCFEAQADNAGVRHLLGEIEVGQLMRDGDILERRIRVSDLPPVADADAFMAVIDEVRG